MKMKYLSLALSAVLATTLTACGGDGDESFNIDPAANETPKVSKETEAKMEALKKAKMEAEKKAQAQAEALKAQAEALKKAQVEAEKKAQAEMEKLKKAQAEAEKKAQAETEKAIKAAAAQAAADTAKASQAQLKTISKQAEEAIKAAKKAQDELDTIKKAEADRIAKEKAEADRIAKEKADKKAKEEAEKLAKEKGLPSEENNIAAAATGGNLKDKFATGNQFYLRNTDSKFALEENTEKGNSGSSMATNFLPLENDSMANIPVAKNIPVQDLKADKALVIAYIGTDTKDRTSKDSLQTFNAPFIDENLEKFANTGKTNGLIYHDGSIISKDNAKLVTGKEDYLTGVKSRIFGANWLADNTTKTKEKNSRIFSDFSQTVAGTTAKSKADQGVALLGLTDIIDLKEVQYGRVTANLDEIGKVKVTEDDFMGQDYYYQISPDETKTDENATTYLTVGNNNAKAVSHYFYRGLNRSGENDTKALPESGTANYFGQALMYGIDNSYHNDKKDSTGSNSILRKEKEFVDAIGNFVKAEVDFGTKKVDGSVYNVWRKIDGTLDPNDVVKFSGNIVGKNNVKGDAALNYEPAEGIPKTADFQGAFFGHAGAEFGGAFDTVAVKDGVGGYGKKAWGGTFGAKKIEPKKSGSGFLTERPK